MTKGGALESSPSGNSLLGSREMKTLGNFTRNVCTTGRWNSRTICCAASALGDATDATDVPAAQKVVGRLSRSLVSREERDYEVRGGGGRAHRARSLALAQAVNERRSGELPD